MCTITLVPHPDSINGFILTSNRDEAVSRRSLPPQTEVYREKHLHFPKDKRAGGTWIGLSENRRSVCLMNGADRPHKSKKEYRKSRGVVVKDFLAGEDLDKLFEEYDLTGIEPFTMIVVDWCNGLIFREFLWDGVEPRLGKLPLKEHIWSSSPLYTEEMKKSRENWFRDLKYSEGLSPESLLKFHQHTETENMEYGLIIDRGFLKTQSISQIQNEKENTRFWYRDLINNKIQEEYIQFSA